MTKGDVTKVTKGTNGDVHFLSSLDKGDVHFLTPWDGDKRGRTFFDTLSVL